MPGPDDTYRRLRDEMLRVYGPREGHGMLAGVTRDPQTGSLSMPGYGGQMTDREIAAILSSLENAPTWAEGRSMPSGEPGRQPSLAVPLPPGALGGVEPSGDGMGSPVESGGGDELPGGEEDLSAYDALLEMADEVPEPTRETPKRPAMPSRDRLRKIAESQRVDPVKLSRKLWDNTATVENTGAFVIDPEGSASMLRPSEISPVVLENLAKAGRPNVLGIFKKGLTDPEIEYIKTFGMSTSERAR